MKPVSAGFIIFDRSTGKVLACHAPNKEQGEFTYDIPKGHIEEGEMPLPAALRELREEAGILPEQLSDIYEIGRVPYRKDKGLHLFSAVCDVILDSLKCTTYFTDNFGKEHPEITSYILTDNPNMFFKNLAPNVDAEIKRRKIV